MDNNNNNQNNKYEPNTLFGLGWNPATRDDEVILDALRNGKELEEIYSLTEEGLLDPFFS